MADFLAQMAASSRARADRLPTPELQLAATALPPLVPLALQGFDLIAEVKDRSPAEGDLAGDGATLDRVSRARAYARGGAAAISVLTEPDRFAGQLVHLTQVASAVADENVPVMRKDFLVDVRQIVEARVAGASGVLLIAAILDDAALHSMLDCAADHGLFVLLESFDEADLTRSAALLEETRYADTAAAGTLLMGVNTRNLRTLEVDPNRLERLAPQLPAAAVAVAESGLRGPDDTRRVATLGYRAGLVGTALMRADDPEHLVAAMLAAARSGEAA